MSLDRATRRTQQTAVWFARHFRRLAIAVVGIAIVGAGLALLVLPGPGVLVILAGLAVLATEFAWAERTLERARTRAARTVDSVKTINTRRSTKEGPSS